MIIISQLYNQPYNVDNIVMLVVPKGIWDNIFKMQHSPLHIVGTMAVIINTEYPKWKRNPLPTKSK